MSGVLSEKSQIIRFYMGEKIEVYPYTIENILDFSDEELEKIHNYIQWLFPTQDPRNKDTGKPFLTDEDIEYFKSKGCKHRLHQYIVFSFDKMITFYGLQYLDVSDGRASISKSADYCERAENWINRGNHNYLRLTRIISCLRSLGFNDRARALYEFLINTVAKENFKQVGNTTIQFWSSAYNQTLYDAYIGKEEEIKQIKNKFASLGSDMFTLGNYKP